MLLANFGEDPLARVDVTPAVFAATDSLTLGTAKRHENALVTGQTPLAARDRENLGFFTIQLNASVANAQLCRDEESM